MRRVDPGLSDFDATTAVKTDPIESSGVLHKGDYLVISQLQTGSCQSVVSAMITMYLFMR